MKKASMRHMACLPIVRFAPDDAVEHAILMDSDSADGLAVHFITAHTVSVAEGDASLRAVLTSGDLLMPGSRWLELFSGIRHRKLNQVRGPDFFRRVLSSGASLIDGHFFITPDPELTDALNGALERDFPDDFVAGVYVAPRGPLTSDEVKALTAEINATGRSIVWLGVGTPAQNHLAHTLARASGRIVIGVGAAFEFLARVKLEAPWWMSKLGVEWLFGLLSEPKRLWRRYLIGNAVFVWAVARHKFKASM